jgi:hypothetical protein
LVKQPFAAELEQVPYTMSQITLRALCQKLRALSQKLRALSQKLNAL